MLKISNTKSIKPRKYVLGVSGSGKKEYINRAKSVGRHKVGDNKVDDKTGENQKTSKSKNCLSPKRR